MQAGAVEKSVILDVVSGRLNCCDSQASRSHYWGCTLHHSDPSASQSKIPLLFVSILSFLMVWKLNPGYDFPFHRAIEQTPPSTLGKNLEN